MLPVDKSRYGPSAFKANKSLQSNSLRFCYELRCLLALSDSTKPTLSFTKYLDRIQHILMTDKSQAVRVEIADVFARDGLAVVIVRGLAKLDFETGKQLLALLTSFINVSPRLQSSLLSSLSDFLPALLSGYGDSKLYIICGQFFRELLQYPALTEAILSVQTLRNLVIYCKSPQFEVSADAFESFKVLITCEFPFLPLFLASNYSEIEPIFEDLRRSDNYFLKRQTLSLTFTLLEQPRNRQFCSMYVLDPEHTKNAMTTFKSDSSRQVKMESFYVFSAILHGQLQESREIQMQSASLKIIRKNKERLISFVLEFGQEIEEEKFHIVKNRVLEELRVI